MTCRICGAELDGDDVGATRKMINRGETSFCCIACLSKHFDIPQQTIRKKIEEWKAYGCTLFARSTDEKRD